MEISMTDFVDFVSKPGTQRMTAVKKAKEHAMTEYEHFKDFWRPLREAIIAFHKGNGQNKKELDKLMVNITNKTKQTWYPIMVNAYKGFLGRKKIEWFQPTKSTWSHGNLAVRVNPELGLEINGKKYLIKLYFKKDKLTSDRVQSILHLMQLELHDNNPDCVLAILDIRNKKLFEAKELKEELTHLLNAEALAFASMFNAL